MGGATKGLGTSDVPGKRDYLSVLVAPLEDIGGSRKETPRIKHKSGQEDWFATPLVRLL